MSQVSVSSRSALTLFGRLPWMLLIIALFSPRNAYRTALRNFDVPG